MWNQEGSLSANETARSARGTAPGILLGDAPAVAGVGKSVIFKGDLISLEDLTIDGRVEGTIQLRDSSLTIGREAQVHADVNARTVTVLGTMTGKIVARETVVIRETGSVEGNITSPRFAMADGAQLKGRVDAGARAADRPDPKLRLSPAEKA